MNSEAITERFRKIINLFLATAFCMTVLTLLGCATTSSGTNRHQIVSGSQVPALPFRIMVDGKGTTIESVGTAEKVDYRQLILISGIHSAWIGPLAKNETAVALIRGRFAAGKAFEEVGKMISSADSTAPVMRLELIRFKHYGSAKTLGHTGVSGIMEFSASMLTSGESTISSYAFEWGKKGTFFARQERDVLREIIEYAFTHWVRQIEEGRWGNAANVFPETSSGEFSMESANYAYVIFRPWTDNKR